MHSCVSRGFLCLPWQRFRAQEVWPVFPRLLWVALASRSVPLRPMFSSVPGKSLRLLLTFEITLCGKARDCPICGESRLLAQVEELRSSLPKLELLSELRPGLAGTCVFLGDFIVEILKGRESRWCYGWKNQGRLINEGGYRSGLRETYSLSTSTQCSRLKPCVKLLLRIKQ